MSGKEDASAGGANGCQEPCQLANSGRMYWRSASWLSSRTSLTPLNPNIEKDGLDPNGGNSSHGRRPLAPRSTQSFKARLRLPPLHPLAIARRSLDEWLRSGFDDIGEWPLPSTPSGRDTNSNSERHKLDLSNIHKNPEITGGLVRREKISFFDKECSKVAEHVFLGGDAVAKDKDILKQNGITHVLNCVGFVCPEYFKSDFVYQTLWLQDTPSEDITSILYDVFDYFEDVREQHGRVFVHCYQGVSRSTSWLSLILSRSIADPNIGFACQLLQCQKSVHALPLSPGSSLRMYRVAPHSPYNPLHLTPKMLNDPSPSALDSRGEFIIHIPSSLYIWIGKKSDAIMERDARGAVCQIVRYEKVQGPIIIVMEGAFYFWYAFSNFLPLMDKLKNGGDAVESSSKVCPGERKVDMYNIDFEIFQKATWGDFVPAFASCETEHETHLPVRKSSWRMLSITYSQSPAGLSKKCPLSIAERRGSLSKFLKLPLLTDDFERKPGHLKSDANEKGDIGISEVTNESFNEAAAAGDILQSPQDIIESKVDELHMSRDILGVANLSGKKATVFDGFHESWEDKPWNERSPTVLNGVVDTGGASCNLLKTVVYHWPSLEKLATGSIDALDSKGAYLFIILTSGLGKDASRSVYVWVGWSFSRDFSKVRQVDCNGLGDPGQIDWKKVALDVLHQMVLPIDTNIKVCHYFIH
ncbi:hypothetical protein P3S68_024642 [Capsicum galapagoense]